MVIQYTALAAFAFLVSQGKMTLWLGVFAVGLLVSFIFGRGYCGYLCPMNAVMRPAEWLSKKFKLQRPDTPKWLMSSLFPWAFIFLTLAMMLGGKRILQVQLPMLAILLGIAFVVTLFYKPEVFHNRICPFGALLSVSGRFAFRSEGVDASACVGCKLCEKTCAAQAISLEPASKKAVITSALCHQCRACEEVCPTDAIHYGKAIKVK
jgi:polyferredoxin